MNFDSIKPWLAVGVAGAVALSAVLAPALAPAAESKAKPGEKKARKELPLKREVLVCRKGTEDNHARIAIQLAGGKVNDMAYYSKWKPRTCSVHVQRNDAYSKWVDNGSVTTVTLSEEKGAVLIQHDPGKVSFIFRDVDRMRYCGAEGKINGSLAVMRGKPECVLDGVMDDDPTKPIEPARALDAEKDAPDAPPAATK